MTDDIIKEKINREFQNKEQVICNVFFFESDTSQNDISSTFIKFPEGPELCPFAESLLRPLFWSFWTHLMFDGGYVKVNVGVLG